MNDGQRNKKHTHWLVHRTKRYFVAHWPTALTFGFIMAIFSMKSQRRYPTMRANNIQSTHFRQHIMRFVEMYIEKMAKENDEEEEIGDGKIHVGDIQKFNSTRN